MRCSILAFEINFGLEVFSRNFEVCLRMVADGAHIRSLRAYDDVAAITAFPHLDLALFKHIGHLDGFEQRAITLLVMLLDRGDRPEAMRQLLKVLCLGCLCKAIIIIYVTYFTC